MSGLLVFKARNFKKITALFSSTLNTALTPIYLRTWAAGKKLLLPEKYETDYLPILVSRLDRGPFNNYVNRILTIFDHLPTPRKQNY